MDSELDWKLPELPSSKICDRQRKAQLQATHWWHTPGGDTASDILNSHTNDMDEADWTHKYCRGWKTEKSGWYICGLCCQSEEPQQDEEIGPQEPPEVQPRKMSSCAPGEE